MTLPAREPTEDAKAQRVEWQSGGIRMLHDEIATLKAERDMLLSQLQGDTTAQRLTQLEAELTLMQATGVDYESAPTTTVPRND